MNIDLLKKLTKLANNNPNENEANLAARKVCKMLEEGNWSLSEAPKTPVNKPIYHRSDPFVDLQEMIRRAAEQDAKRREQQKQERDKYYSREYNDPEWGHPFWGREKQSSAYSKSEKKSKICTRCNQPRETAYIGNLYVCDVCRWDEWNKARQK